MLPFVLCFRKIFNTCVKTRYSHLFYFLWKPHLTSSYRTFWSRVRRLAGNATRTCLTQITQVEEQIIKTRCIITKVYNYICFRQDFLEFIAYYIWLIRAIGKMFYKVLIK